MFMKQSGISHRKCSGVIQGRVRLLYYFLLILLKPPNRRRPHELHLQANKIAVHGLVVVKDKRSQL